MNQGKLNAAVDKMVFADDPPEDLPVLEVPYDHRVDPVYQALKRAAITVALVIVALLFYMAV
ncbi:MAG: hypothetical protein KAJ07_04605 [Planctomycetes bacterium]|nr:hypothetical protein [Planctomycetota bacterium]